MNELGNNEITPGQNGLPPKKVKNDSYMPEEKSLIVAAAAEVGTHVVADAYGLDWHHIASWKRFYGKESEFDTMSKSKKNNKTVVKKKKNVLVAPAAHVASTMQLIIQSPSGQEITVEDVRARLNTAVDADSADNAIRKVYIRADEGKAYWVRGEGEKEEHGAVELW